MPAGFWDHFFDNDRRQRDDLHDLEVSSISLAGDIHQLRAHVLTLQRQLHDTTILISVLMRMLDEAKVDRDELQEIRKLIDAYEGKTHGKGDDR